MQDDTRWHYPADPERYVYRPVAVNGHEGMLGIYREENGSERCNSIIWMDEETNFQFQISFAWEELQLTENELIAMAESVQMQEREKAERDGACSVSFSIFRFIFLRRLHA